MQMIRLLFSSHSCETVQKRELEINKVYIEFNGKKLSLNINITVFSYLLSDIYPLNQKIKQKFIHAIELVIFIMTFRK
jgi:hypothetical protein